MDLMSLLKTRRTYRRFDERRPVAPEAVADMAEALRLSFSAGNLQPLRAVFVTDPAQAAAIFPHVHFAVALPASMVIHSAVALGYPAHRSTVVTPGLDGSLQYYLDANRDYFVPKREVDEIVMKDRWEG
ncbi:nitroreductase family protein [Pseudoramibacter alactolyticus]|uniref:nitroreductase family protein n=1 Tax=Pseudoramibacter alactolyticus TaxID=113287 RepID=UPI0028EC0D61|nr:nitroreductase family protein [Pseudoramibacter alactolyticus]